MTVQQEAVSLINDLPEDSVKVLIELIKRMNPISVMTISQEDISIHPKRKLGLAAGQYTIPDDIDTCNPEIAEMFGV